jgi:Flp pilus assembly protein TadD
MVMPAAVYAGQDADESALDALDATTPKPVQPKIEPPGAVELRDAVRRIAQRPTDSFALADAGYAAIKLGDFDAAFNFFTRASVLQPADARIKAGLGIAQVRRENPFEALSLFDEALRLGASERSFALDRALAYDLLGNFERAERDYALAASYGQSDEVNLRHAISLSLAGKRDDADRMLVPLLQRENPEAWRARAMMLAARGDYKEAGKIAAGFLAERDARRMEGYFRNMSRLTIAQQAAAMHFGHFPVGSNIGADSEQVKTLAAATGAPVGGSDVRLIPSGQPLGSKPAPLKTAKVKKDSTKEQKPPASGGLATASAQKAMDSASRAKVAQVGGAQLPPPEAARPPVRISLPAFIAPKPAVVLPKPEPVEVTQLPASSPAVIAGSGSSPSDAAQLPATGPAVIANSGMPPVEAVKMPPAQIVQIDPALLNKPDAPPQPGFDTLPATQPGAAVIAKGDVPVMGPTVDGPPVASAAIASAADIPSAEPAGQPAAEVPAAQTVSEKPFDLGALVAAIEVPDAEKRPSTSPVDLTKIRAAKPKVEPAAAAKADNSKTAQAGPRIFVQIATGADADGLSYDFRRMSKKYGTLFAKQEGWTAAWGRTRRLLIGPFTDLKAAKKWQAEFRKAGGEGFIWQSDKGAEVARIK